MAWPSRVHSRLEDVQNFFMVIYQVNRREKNMMISINAWKKKKKTFDKIQCSFQNIWESRNRITKENVIWPKRASLNLQLTSHMTVKIGMFPLRSGVKHGCLLPLPSFNFVLETSTRARRQRRDMRRSNFDQKFKMLFIYK